MDWTKKILLAIVGLAFILRIVGVGNTNSGFLGDEASVGYNAFSILKEGRDEYGRNFPLYFESIGDFKYPVYSYLSVPFVKLFGLTEFSTRFLSVTTGTFSVVLLYLFVFYLTRDKKLGLFSAFMLAISAWHIFFSRGAFEAIVGLFFSLLTIYFYLKLFDQRSRRLFILTILFFLLAIFSYPAYRIFLPLFLIFLYVVKTFNGKLKGKSIAILFLSIFLTFLTLVSFASAESRSRANSLLGGQLQVMNVNRSDLTFEDGLAAPGHTLLTRIYHNKLIDALLNYSSHYINQFNLDFYFVNGDKTRPFYNIPNTGLLYFFELATVPLGLLYLLKKNNKFLLVTVGWILISAIPSALVNEQPSSIRLIMMIPALAVISGAGVYSLVLWIHGFKQKYLKVFFAVLFSFVFIFNVGYVIHQYYSHFPYHRPWYRDYGMKDIVGKVDRYKGNYDYVVMTSDPYIFFLFYDKVTPSQFLSQAKLSERKVGSWERIERFGNIVFKMDVNCPKVGRPKVLYVCKGDEVPQNSKVVDYIRFADRVPAYVFVEFYPLSQMPSKKPDLPDGYKYMKDVDTRNDGLIPLTDSRLW